MYIAKRNHRRISVGLLLFAIFFTIMSISLMITANAKNILDGAGDMIRDAGEAAGDAIKGAGDAIGDAAGNASDKLPNGAANDSDGIIGNEADESAVPSNSSSDMSKSASWIGWIIAIGVAVVIIILIIVLIPKKKDK